MLGAGSKRRCRPLQALTRLRAYRSPATPSACPVQLPDGSRIKSLRVVASIQAPPPGQGIWGQLWLAPTTPKYGAWPASGEVRRRGGQGTAGAGRQRGRCKKRQQGSGAVAANGAAVSLLLGPRSFLLPAD